jgi:hypothetical protein
MEKLKLVNENKISVYVIGGAFFLSLIVGLISGNPAGIVLMRAFLSALLFGIIFQGGLYIIRRYIPELAKFPETSLESEEKIVPDESKKTAGRIIDYEVGENEETLSYEGIIGETTEEGSARPQIVEGEGEIVGSGEDLAAGDEEEAEETEDVSLSDLPSLDSILEDEEETSQEGVTDEYEAAKPLSSNYGEYIKIGDAQIPYEPKALAKAVKKVMKEDESR